MRAACVCGLRAEATAARGVRAANGCLLLGVVRVGAEECNAEGRGDRVKLFVTEALMIVGGGRCTGAAVDATMTDRVIDEFIDDAAALARLSVEPKAMLARGGRGSEPRAERDLLSNSAYKLRTAKRACYEIGPPSIVVSQAIRARAVVYLHRVDAQPRCGCDPSDLRFLAACARPLFVRALPRRESSLGVYKHGCCFCK